MQLHKQLIVIIMFIVYRIYRTMLWQDVSVRLTVQHTPVLC